MADRRQWWVQQVVPVSCQPRFCNHGGFPPSCRSPVPIYGLKNVKLWTLAASHPVLARNICTGGVGGESGMSQARGPGLVSPDSAPMGRVTLDKTLLPDSSQENGCKRTRGTRSGDPREAPGGGFQGGPRASGLPVGPWKGPKG